MSRRPDRGVAPWGCLLLALSMGIVASPAAAQRCAGSVDYIIRDESGQVMSASQASVAYSAGVGFHRSPYRSTRAYDSLHRSRGEDTRRDMGSEPESLTFRTGCGTPLIEVVLEYRGKRMLLRFKNAPPEMNFYVDSLPFQEGQFEVDLQPNGPDRDPDRPYPQNQMPDITLVSGDEKREDLYLKELEHSVVVSARNWKVFVLE